MTLFILLKALGKVQHDSQISAHSLMNRGTDCYTSKLILLGVILFLSSIKIAPNPLSHAAVETGLQPLKVVACAVLVPQQKYGGHRIHMEGNTFLLDRREEQKKSDRLQR